MKAHLAVERLAERSPWPTAPFGWVTEPTDGVNRTGEAPMLSLNSGGWLEPRGSRDDGAQTSSESTTARSWLVEPGDLVLNPMWLSGGGVAVTAMAGAVSPDYRVFKANQEVLNLRYLHHLLRSQPYRDQYSLYTRADTTFDRRVSRATFAALPVLTPPLETQRRIAAMLDAETTRIDTLIEKKLEAVGSIQVRLERLRWDLVTGSTSSTERREVPLAWTDTLPELWPLASLQYLITSKYGFPFKSDGFASDPASTPVVRIRDVVPNRVQTWTEEAPVGNVWLENGDIVIGMDGDFNHVRWEGGRAALNQRVCSVRSLSENLTDEFLSEVLRYPLRHINETVHFTTVKHLSFSALMAQKIPVPPVTKQATIVRELSRERDATERLTSAANRSVKLLRTRRQALITAAVTGQIEI